MKALRSSAKRLYPNSETTRFNITGRLRFALPHSSGGGRRSIRTSRNEDSNRRGNRDARQATRRNRRKRQDR